MDSEYNDGCVQSFVVMVTSRGKTEMLHTCLLPLLSLRAVLLVSIQASRLWMLCDASAVFTSSILSRIKYTGFTLFSYGIEVKFINLGTR